MPDIQTALTNALKNKINQWEKEDMQTTNASAPNYVKGKTPFSVTNNVTRATFDFVKKNPNLTSAEICADMEKMGYKESSVGSLLAQFAKQGMAERDDRGRYIMIVNEYTPLKAKKKAKPAPVVEAPPKRKYEKKNVAGIAALQATMEKMAEPSQPTAPKHFLTRLVRSQTPEEVIGNMTVYQARELYLHLKQMFGG